MVRMAWPTIDLFHEDLFDLDMISAVLSEGKSSRLRRKLVEEAGLTDSIDTWSWTPWYMPGAFGIAFQVPAESLERAIGMVREEIRRIREEPATPAEVERAKTLLVCRHEAGLQKVEDQAAQAGIDLLTTGDPRFSARYVERIRAYRPDRMAGVAGRWLRDDGLSIVVLRPRGSPAAGAAGAPREESGSGSVREATLGNGMRLVVRRVPGIVPVGVEVFFHGGLRAEPAGKNGVSNLTARLLLRGTAKRSAAEIVDALEERGGSISSQSGNHTIGLSVTLPRGAEDLPAATEVLADILGGASFPEGEFEREHRIAVMLAARQGDVWQSEAFHFARQEAFGDGPYGHPAGGTPESLAAVTRADVLAFARRWVDPRGMVVCVAGEVDPEATLELLGKAFGGLAGPSSYAPPAPPAPEWAGGSFPADRFAFRGNAKTQAVLTISFAGPAWAEVADRAALTVVDAFTSGLGLPSGWFHEALRGGEQSLVYFVHLSVFTGLEGGLSYVMTQTRPDLLGKVFDLTMAQVARLRRGEYTDEEIAIGKAVAMVAAPADLQTVNDLAQTAALGVLYGVGHDFEARYEAAVRGVTRADIERVVKRYFGRSVVTVTGSPEVEKVFESLR
jgi:zinc protease